MRPEKKLLLQEVARYLEPAGYLYLVDFTRIPVPETEELRRALRAQGALFHVVKNRLLQRALQERGMADLRPVLTGPTAIVAGGENPSAVAKILLQFRRQHEDKLPVRGGVLQGHPLGPDEGRQLSELPTLEELRARLLALLQEPARRLPGVLQAVSRSLLQVLRARAEKA